MTVHIGTTISQRGALTVIDCETCGFNHLNPLPSESELSDYYANEFWQRTKIGTRDRMDAQRDWWAAVYGDWVMLTTDHAPGMSLLDVGAGYGHFIDAAQSIGFDAHGIEPSRDVN